MKTLFGYNANPSLIEVFAYGISFTLMILLYNKKAQLSSLQSEVSLRNI